MKEELRTSSDFGVRVVVCTVSDSSKVRLCRVVRHVHAPDAFTAVQGAFPMDLSRPSSFASGNAPEASLGSSEEGRSVQASLQRCILRTEARHCRVTQQRMRSRRQARRGPQDYRNRAPHMREANSVTVLSFAVDRVLVRWPSSLAA